MDSLCLEIFKKNISTSHNDIYIFNTFDIFINFIIHVIFISLFTQDVFRLETPGGGGYGSPTSNDEDYSPQKKRKLDAQMRQSGSVFSYKQLQESA